MGKVLGLKHSRSANYIRRQVTYLLIKPPKFERPRKRPFLFFTNTYMKKILIIDNEKLLTKENVNGYAEVYTLYQTDITEFEGIPVICIPEITESTLNNGEKFKELISEINRRHSFEYEVLTNDKEQYAVKNYICDFVECPEGFVPGMLR